MPGGNNKSGESNNGKRGLMVRMDGINILDKEGWGWG